MNYQLLKDELNKPENDGKTDAEIVAALYAKTIPNPEPQGAVLRALVKMEVMSHLSEESVAKVLFYPNLPLVFEAFNNQDHPSSVSWVYSLWMAKQITEAERNACVAFIQTPIPDPAWSPLVSWCELHETECSGQDLRIARLIDKAAFARQRAEVWKSITSNLEAGNDVDIEGVS